MQTYRYLPANVTALTGWSPELLRDYRLKGYLSQYGQKQDNGHWRYSGRDMVGFWTAKQLHHRGKVLDLPVKGERPVDLRRLFEHSWNAAEFVAKHIAGREAPNYWGLGDVVPEKGTSPWGETLSINQPVQFRANTLEQVERLNLYAMDIVNCKGLASFAPQQLIDEVQGMIFIED